MSRAKPTQSCVPGWSCLRVAVDLRQGHRARARVLRQARRPRRENASSSAQGGWRACPGRRVPGARRPGQTPGARRVVEPGRGWEEEPGWDEATVVRGFSIHRMPAAGDTARLAVRFDRAGIIEPKDEAAYRFVPRDSSEDEVFKVVRVRGRWKIADPQIEPHVRAVARKRYAGALDSASLARLRAVRLDDGAATPRQAHAPSSGGTTAAPRTLRLRVLSASPITALWITRSDRRSSRCSWPSLALALGMSGRTRDAVQLREMCNPNRMLLSGRGAAGMGRRDA